MTGRGVCGVVLGFTGSTGVVTVGAAVAVAETAPISIMLPARSPPWSAINFTRSAVTVALADRGASSTVSTIDPSSSRLPHSASGTTEFADGVMSCPSTVRPVTDDAEMFPEALAEPAATLVRTSSESMEISPPNNDIARAPTFAWALDDTPGWTATPASADPIRTIEPSSG